MREAISVGLLSAVLACGIAHGDDQAQHVELDNGLRVILRPVEGAANAAMVLLYDIGEAHDPPGKSGMGHLFEHLYVTAAAGDTPVRTADDWMKKYRGQANAQTGRAYTLVASTFSKEELPRELTEAAARMTALCVEPADLARELPRLELELTNMYGGMPQLAVLNLAAGAADPLGAGARKGGVMEQIATIGLDEIGERHRRYYKPANAILVLAGGIDAAQARALVQERFAGIDRGERIPEPRPAAAPTLGRVQRVTVAKPVHRRFPDGIAALAFRVPPPQSDQYAPFLVLMTRLFDQSSAEVRRMRAEKVPVKAFTYWPLDRPGVISLSTDVDADTTDEEAVAPLRGQVDDAAAMVDANDWSQRLFLQNFGPMLGLRQVPDEVIKRYPYTIAFSLGRRVQLGIDPDALRTAIDGVTMEQLERCRQEIFGPDRGAAVVVRLE
jgi:zinc protease